MLPEWFNLTALIGGLLIGAASMVLWLLVGKIAGVSGIVGNIVGRTHKLWHWMFVVGLMLGGLVFAYTHPGVTPVREGMSPVLLAVAGLLVGLGTGIGSGCTSGHGVCGMGRLSGRSLVATCIFMCVAAIVVAIRNHVL